MNGERLHKIQLSSSSFISFKIVSRWMLCRQQPAPRKALNNLWPACSQVFDCWLPFIVICAR